MGPHAPPSCSRQTLLPSQPRLFGWSPLLPPLTAFSLPYPPLGVKGVDLGKQSLPNPCSPPPKLPPLNLLIPLCPPLHPSRGCCHPHHLTNPIASGPLPLPRLAPPPPPLGCKGSGRFRQPLLAGSLPKGGGEGVNWGCAAVMERSSRPSRDRLTLLAREWVCVPPLLAEGELLATKPGEEECNLVLPKKLKSNKM